MRKIKEMLIRLLLIGCCNVGKTSLRNQLFGNFRDIYRETIGADFLTKDICTDKYQILLQLWDISGKCPLNLLGNNFYKTVDGCILV